MSVISAVSFIDVVRDTGRLGGQIYPLIVAVNDQKSVVAHVGMGNPSHSGTGQCRRRNIFNHLYSPVGRSIRNVKRNNEPKNTQNLN